MSQRRELIDRARFQEVHQETKDKVARNVM